MQVVRVGVHAGRHRGTGHHHAAGLQQRHQVGQQPARVRNMFQGFQGYHRVHHGGRLELQRIEVMELDVRGYIPCARVLQRIPIQVHPVHRDVVTQTLRQQCAPVANTARRIHHAPRSGQRVRQLNVLRGKRVTFQVQGKRLTSQAVHVMGQDLIRNQAFQTVHTSTHARPAFPGPPACPALQRRARCAAPSPAPPP